MISKRVLKEFQECVAFGLQLDETSDISKKEKLVIMAKIVMKGGKIVTRLLELY